MAKIFEKVRLTSPKKNAFDLSYEKKMSGKFGYLYPCFLEEIIPGDQFRVNTEVFLRFAPMIAPVMHRINVFVHYFFVPNRLTFDKWEDYITGGEDGLDATVFPTLSMNNTYKTRWLKGKVGDYFGVPILDGGTTYNYDQDITSLPFRAYQMIYNEYYRDQNLESEVSFGVGTSADGDSVQLTTLRKRSWEKDYLTSCLPWAQRGAEVDLPIEMSPGYEPISIFKDGSGILDGSVTGETATGHLQVGGDEGWLENLGDPQTGFNITITELRNAKVLQEWLEKNARIGSRYIEQIQGHFGVRVPDHRLQRPEFLGGGRIPVVISEVLNTSDTANAEQGNMAGHGLAISGKPSFRSRFSEHGYVIGILSVMPRTAYSQALNRRWLKNDKFDYFWPSFAHIGEQEVQNQEVMLDLENDSSHHGTFGYQQRYGEYKYRNSEVSGDFRSTFDHWHLARSFSTRPTLNTAFVQCDESAENLDRIFAVQDGSDYLWMQLYHNVKAIRPIPYFGDPKL